MSRNWRVGVGAEEGRGCPWRYRLRGPGAVLGGQSPGARLIEAVLVCLALSFIDFDRGLQHDFATHSIITLSFSRKNQSCRGSYSQA